VVLNFRRANALFKRARKTDSKSLHVAYNYALMLLSQKRSDEAVRLWMSFRNISSSEALNFESLIQHRQRTLLQAPTNRSPGVVCIGEASEIDALRLDVVIFRIAKQNCGDISQVLQMF
jgi:hypothetical protein